MIQAKGQEAVVSVKW